MFRVDPFVPPVGLTITKTNEATRFGIYENVDGKPDKLLREGPNTPEALTEAFNAFAGQMVWITYV